MGPWQVNGFRGRTVLRAAATGLGVGYCPLAPGTAGSLLALPLWYAGGGWGVFHFAALAAVALLSVPAARVVMEDTGAKDPPVVVIDEIAGMLLAATGIPWGWKRALFLFILFRFLDVLKPGPAGWANARRGPVFVLADDLAAGLLANLSYRVLAWLLG